MLRFTPEQMKFVANTRRAHARQHENMQRIFGNEALQGNASPLPRDVWGEWDREAVTIQREELRVFNDLAASVSQPMPLGKIIHFFQTVSDSGELNISLDGRSSAKTDQPVFDYHGTPVPILDSTFNYGWRQMLAAQTEGFSLDPAGRENAMRRVAEGLESLVLDGDSSISVNGAKLYGLRTHPLRPVRSTGVQLAGATGPEWRAEMVATLKLLHDNQFKTGATIYVNWDDWFYAGTTDFSTQYPNKTVAMGVLETEGVDAIVPSDSLAPNEIIAVVKRRSVLQILNGMPMATRAKTRLDPEDDYYFKTMAAAALELKFTANEQMGIAHSS